MLFKAFLTPGDLDLCLRYFSESRFHFTSFTLSHLHTPSQILLQDTRLYILAFHTPKNDQGWTWTKSCCILVQGDTKKNGHHLNLNNF